MRNINKASTFVAVSFLVLTIGFGTVFAAGNTTATGTSNATGKDKKMFVFFTDGVDLTSGKCPGHDADGQEAAGGGEGSQSLMAAMMDVVKEAFIEGNKDVDVTTLESRPCGDSSALVRKLLQAMASYPVNGVITAMSSSSFKAVAEITKSLDIPLVQMVPGDEITASSIHSHHYIMPHYAFNQMQIFLGLADTFNWTSVSVRATGTKNKNKVDKAVETLQSQAYQGGMCVMSPEITAPVPIVVVDSLLHNKSDFRDLHNFPDTGPVVLFGPEEDGIAIVDDSPNVDTLLAVPTHRMFDDVFQRLGQSMPCRLNDSADVFSNGTELEKKLDTLCVKFESLESPRNQLDFAMNVGNVLTSLSFLLHYGEESNLNVPECNSTDSTDGVDVCPLFNGIAYKLDEKSKMVTSGVIENSKLYNDKIGQMKTLNAGSVDIRNESQVSELYNKDCGDYCHLCRKCFPSEKSLNRALISQYPQPFKLVGFFPLHSKNCKEWNVEGILKSLTFLHSIEALNNKSASSPTRYQGVVVDSCDSQPMIDMLLQDIASCRYSFPVITRTINGTDQPESVALQSNLISAYFMEQGNDVAPSSTAYGDVLKWAPSPPLPSSPPVVMTISRAGYSSYGNSHSFFVTHLHKVLVSLKWTVVNVIVSEDYVFTNMATSLTGLLDQSETSCIVNSIRINAKTKTTEDLIDSVSNAFKQTPVFVLLTSEKDTRTLLNGLKTSTLNAGAKKKMSFLFTPWNSKLANVNITKSLTSTNIFLEQSAKYPDAVPIDASSITKLASLYPEFSKMFEDKKETVSAGFDDALPELQLVQSSVTALVKGGGGQGGTRQGDLLESTGLDIFMESSDLERKLIGKIDKELQLDANVRPNPHEACLTWCPSCNICRGKNKPDVTYFYNPGDVIITSVLPLHHKGDTPFQCGSLQDKKGRDVSLAFAFIWAIDTFKLRYPPVRGNISVGGLLLDYCSDQLIAAKTISDFESCRVSFEQGSESESKRIAMMSSTTSRSSENLVNSRDVANPKQNLGYFIGDETPTPKSETLDSTLNDVVGNEKVHQINLELENEHVDIGDAVVKAMKALGWSRAVMAVEDGPLYNDVAEKILKAAKDNLVCIVYVETVTSGDEWKMEKILEPFHRYPVIAVAQKSFINTVFNWLGGRSNKYYWILPAASGDWSDLGVPVSIPIGTLFVSTSSAVSGEKSLLDTDGGKLSRNDLTVHSNWMKELWSFLYSCKFSTDAAKPCSSVMSYSMETAEIFQSASSLVRRVDAFVHKVNEAHSAKCGEQDVGVCDKLVPEVLGKSLGPSDVSFKYKGEMVSFDETGQLHQTWTFLIRQTSGFDKVGTYFSKQLQLDLTRINAVFLKNFLTPPYNVSLKCEQCGCVSETKYSGSATSQNSKQYHGDLPAHDYHSHQGEFFDEIWTKVIISISCVGAFFSLCILFYVIYKVCSKAIGRRYVGLGLFLLFSLVLLYLSVISFTFSPTETICGLRYLFPSVAFAFTFAGILVKLMSLQSHKIAGLGGELSIVNQFLTVFFITGVQIAISVQWWHYNSPMVHSKIYVNEGLKHACNFDSTDFSLNQIYNLFLLLLSCIYALVVRKEKRNMGEAKLLLVSCCLCALIWLAFLLCLFLWEDAYKDEIICVAVLACACIITGVVFIPKLRMVARLKYSVSQKKGNPHTNNGYNVDSDFLYERPFSLPVMPGTLTSPSSFSSIMNNKDNIQKKRYSKSSLSPSSVDFDINY